MIFGKKILGIITTRINTPSANLLITRLDEKLAEHDYRIFVYSTCSELDSNAPAQIGEKSVFELVDFDILDAIVVTYEKIKDRKLANDIIDRAKQHGKPVFVVGGRVEGCINLTFNYKEGMREITRHVLGGHNARRPHFMAGFEGNSFSEERIEAFREVLAEFDIPFDDSMVSYGDFWSDPTMAATQRLIDSGELPDALICANDTMAVAACSALQANGIAVPDDIIVTGFDGINDVKISNPTITTSMCSNAEIADIIAELLVDEKKLAETHGDHLVMPRLSLAQSCGCVNESGINASAHLTKLNDRFNRYQTEETMLFDMMAKIFTCDNIGQMSKYMSEVGFYELVCVLRKECIDETVNPLKQAEIRDKENLYVLYDTDASEDFTPYEFKSSMIFPNLEKQLQYGHPLIFVALNFLNIPLGYVCFHYHSYEMDNYYKVPQTINIINSAVGGYRNMRYQHYLTNKMEELYQCDRLTGLYNRNALVKTYEELQDDLRSGQHSITFILCDLDRLKYINDTFGHIEGDYAIRAVADALRVAVPDESLLARWGGDEMVALFTGDCDEKAIRSSIGAFLEELALRDEKPYDITASIGIVTVAPEELVSLDELTKSADRLMYEDKMERRKARV